MIPVALRLHGRAGRQPLSAITSRRRFSSLLKYALVDIDGVLVLGSQEVPGSVNALSKLREGVLGCRLVTNQSQESRASLVERLRDVGFDVGQRDVFSALTAARQLVDRLQLRPLCLLADKAHEEFSGVPMHEPNSVLIGTAPEHLHYEQLTQAARVLLQDDGNRLVAVNKGRYFKRDDGLALMAGPFVAALEFATSRQATVIGKPCEEFFHSAVADAAGSDPAGQLPLHNCVMIGDDALDDVQGAMDAGMKAILVRSGKYRPGDENLCRTPPLAVVDNLAHALDFLQQSGLLMRN
eukprot:gb/GFBE01011578.1/.p1 GENE.gb/GFBE01011578.1/~~gb/GFBE01011578.1/.p1  ORF type:complete len:296 (+),score=64.92 gb/GFBE01011578.1/:1-888(+)